MDLKKAQRLLTKIEAFLDNGNAQDLSRLEKDLIKSYVIQLYDAVTDDIAPAVKEEEKPIEFVEYKMPKRETTHKTEIPQVREIEPTKPVYTDHVVSTPKEKSVESEVPVQPQKTYHHVPEPVKEVIHASKTNQSSTEINDQLVKLFDLPKTDEMSGRYNHVPIASIESAMGLNERIFTLNELFGGDKALFDATCSRLNHLSSYAEAKALLMAGPARDFHWSETGKLKMAEQFIRIVTRRYPKSVS